MPDPFATPLWLSNVHLQSLGAAIPLWAPPRSFQPSRSEALRIALPTAGALHAHAWWQTSSLSSSEARVRTQGTSSAGSSEALARRPTAIVVHGVGGSSASRYVVRAAVCLHRAGWHVVRLDLRGAGDSIPDAPALYHAGLTEDIRVAVERIGARPHVDGVALVGFSLGGHVVLRFLGEVGASLEPPPEPLRAAVAISAPLDLTQVVRAIERLRSIPYHLYVLRHLVRQAEAFARAHPARAHYGLRLLRRLRSIRAYDQEVISPMHGFAGADDYYVQASAGPLVHHIRIPTLLVHAEDDPMVPADTVRAWLGRAPPALEPIWTRRGGHVGWFTGLSESSWIDTWAMARARSFLTETRPIKA